MKKLTAVLLTFAVLLGLGTYRYAKAGITCTLPFQLQNNTTADATQVMANYNALVTCFTSAAAAGVNSDITSLLALTTPLPANSGGSTSYVGGTSTGTATAQELASVSPIGFTKTAGRKVTFIAGATNTGAMTLNVNSTGATNVFRRIQTGVSTTVGGEVIVGQQVEVIFDGTQYQILSGGIELVGELKDFSGTSATVPNGHLFADGTCVSRTTFAALFTVIGTQYDPTGSTCNVANFALPDGRGRVFAGDDDQGNGGAANRITSAGSGCVGTTLGAAGCGAQNKVLVQGNLPNVSLTTTTVDSRTWSIQSANAGAGSDTQVVLAANTGTPNNTPAVTVSGSSSLVGSTPTGGSGTAVVILPPLQIVRKIIKY